MSKQRKSRKPTVSPEVQAKREQIFELYNKYGGNASAVARHLGIPRSTVHRHIKKFLGKKTLRPVAGGTIRGVVHESFKLPSEGNVRRYILTSAQNNTFIHPAVLKNLEALAKYYSAEILVGTYSYNKNAYGPLAVKRGTFDSQDKPWYDERIEKYIVDHRRQLGDGLVWCGEMNIIPTEVNPLSGLETYSGSRSCIFPHARIEMRSVATMQGHGTKLMYTTGTVTKRNYIQKKAGLKAEHSHAYGGTLVEIDSLGHWWVRQLEADENTGRIQDLNVVADDGIISLNGQIEAITWGDSHATAIEPTIKELTFNMLDTLKPRYQFIHDLLEGVSVNHHNARNPHEKFKAFMRGYDIVTKELQDTVNLLQEYVRSGSEIIVVDSNHDNWLMRWLREHDYRQDPHNAILFLEGQLEVYRQIQGENERFNLTEWAMRKFNCDKHIKFLLNDDSFTICNKKIECGMHGHLGPDGAHGTVSNLSKMGRKANTAHTHSASIVNGLYTAGTSTKLRMGYNHGPSSWTHSHIVTYPNGKRTIITIYNEKWRA